MSDELINKYRPKRFEEVIGQEKVCDSIQLALHKKRGRTFLLTGPSGVGKTTVGRIIANEVGCPPFDLIEIDGATNTGIDAMREVTSRLGYSTIGGGSRVIIVDECHAISAQAWKSLLKSLEEPPSGVYWVLCTTDPTKVPKEVKTRCLAYTLAAVSAKDIKKLLMFVAKSEKLPIRRSAEAMDVLVEEAEGSPRKALSMLAQVGHLSDEDEVRSICQDVGVTSKEAIDLCRLLMKRAPWKEIQKCINSIEGGVEGVRVIVMRYMCSVALKQPKPGDALAIMAEFEQPFVERDGKAPLVLACGRLYFQD